MAVDIQFPCSKLSNRLSFYKNNKRLAIRIILNL